MNSPTPGDESRLPKVIQLEGATNFRDLGGYPTETGLIKSGEVYRSGRLPRLTDEDVAVLEELGIRTVVTLLTSGDVEEYGQDRLPEGASLVELPIDSETATELATRARDALATGDFSAVPAELNPEIHRLLIGDGRRQYGQLMRLVADPSNRPLVFHCSHGVHRTGTAAAILLSLLGVEWNTVRRDYLASNECRSIEVEERLAHIRAALAARLDVAPSKVDMTNVEAFMIQSGSYIDASRERVLAEYGSFDAYAKDGMGLRPEDLTRLRAELIA